MPTLNWIGKEAVTSYHNEVPFRTLEKQYVFNAEDSENMIIHGDNLEALKALLPKYEGQVKCIYIDPPYNTGKENWVYNDNVNSPKIRKWLGEAVGKEAEDFSRHDKWLCMMYPRLKLLQRLLSEDGAIFISIDDNEQANLKLICDEIFGARNFVAQVIWERAFAPINLKKHFSESHDYILCYAKNIDELICNGLPRTEEANARYSNPDNDPRGPWTSGDLSVGPRIEEKVYEITTPSGRVVVPPNGYCWRLDKDTFEEYKKNNKIWFGEDGNSVPRIKRFLSEVKQGITPMTIWKHTEVGHSQGATKELKEIFNGRAVFDYPKSVNLIKRCFELYSDKDSIILDSFAGSGTTAQAVLNLNKQDGGHRKFILVEMEDYAENTTAERARRVIKGYGEDKKTVEGTGGDFAFYELGQPLFNEDGNLNEAVGTDKIREYIWYSETHSPYTKYDGYLLGSHNSADYYFYYEPDRFTTLCHDTLNIVSQEAEQYIIYADICTLSQEELTALHIIFKKIPRDINRF